MYPQCRYLRPGGQICRAVALKGSEWCYHHARLHQRYRAQQARHRLHKQRDASGRFTPGHKHSPKANCMDARPSQPSHPHLRQQVHAWQQTRAAKRTLSKPVILSEAPRADSKDPHLMYRAERRSAAPNKAVSPSEAPRTDFKDLHRTHRSRFRPSRTARPYSSPSPTCSRPSPPTSLTPNAPASSSTACRSHPRMCNSRMRSQSAQSRPRQSSAARNSSRNSSWTRSIGNADIAVLTLAS
jgi:hypothetical protein